MTEKKLTKEELLATLERLRHEGDKEYAHQDADNALLQYIDLPEVTEAFNRLEKWYA